MWIKIGKPLTKILSVDIVLKQIQI
jgi:hypothetical protein